MVLIDPYLTYLYSIGCCHPCFFSSYNDLIIIIIDHKIKQNNACYGLVIWLVAGLVAALVAASCCDLRLRNYSNDFGGPTTKQPIVESDAMVDRFKKLAGII